MPENDSAKTEILNQIRKMANVAGGIPPGQIKFARETGIKDHIWRAKIWLNWSDALAEAGFSSRDWVIAYDNDFLVSKASELAKKLGHFPSQAELKFEHSKKC